ncbi:MAG: PEP/pyruvate-binding domain-containing protein [bacterium]
MAATPNLLTPQSCLAHPKLVGGKGLHLAELLIEQKLPVPEFLVVPTTTCVRLTDNSLTAEALQAEAVSLLPAARYAVRSSALAEDSAHSAMAGQFSTLLDLSPDEVAAAIQSVLDDAIKKTGDPSQCAVIIQIFLPAKYSGVLFTRNPKGSREAVIEYVPGRGDALVSGQVQPPRLSHVWNQSIPKQPAWADGLLEYGASIEKAYEHPQDIEWCLVDGALHILQARPITTLTAGDYADFLFLDETMPSEPFLFEQTEVTEIAPRPTPLTLSLLQSIYAKEGPIDQVYHSFGVQYRSTDFLKVIGNQLYIDRQAERQGFFPENGLRERLLARNNKKALQKLRCSDPKEINAQLQKAFAEPTSASSPKDALSQFLNSYRLVFTVNLYAQAALTQLGAAGRPLKRTAAELLEVPGAIRLEGFPEDLLKGLKGSSLEIGDMTLFKRTSGPTTGKTPEWFAKLPEWQRRFIQPHIDTAQAYLELRERGRWYTVWLVNWLRSGLSPFDPFLSVEEYLSGSKPTTAARKKAWDEFNHRTFPPRLSDLTEDAGGHQSGISPGTASGTVVSAADLPANGKAILAARLLTPDLVDLFPHISGIIATTGGLLSHLAIMAREAGIPVVSGVGSIESYLGCEVTIDGTAGTIAEIREDDLTSKS